MKRSADDVRRDADDLARAFEDYEPKPGQMRDATSLRAVADAREQVYAGQRGLARAVHAAREDGQTWAAIGAMLDMSGEAARQRYGKSAARRSRLHLRVRAKVS
jgi:hypothetical protein